MRQVRPRTTHPAVSSTDITVDLRPDDRPDSRPGREVTEARRAVEEARAELAALVAARDALLSELIEPAHPADPDDQSIVPWGFYDEGAA
ncbi:MAG: hypothetical protein KJO87_01825 [Acidimicrobiia bacterium]|nr:hypothetical protein [Acidimicrobiia bacterium]